jgi:hypothetical protein
MAAGTRPLLFGALIVGLFPVQDARADGFFSRAHAPPLPRAAFALGPGAWSMSLGEPVELYRQDVTLYQLDGTDTAQLPFLQPLPDLHFRFGVGEYWEFGFSPTLHVSTKVTVMDEYRTPDVPLSLAISADLGWRSAGIGLMASREMPKTDRFLLRPTLGLWLAYHEATGRTYLDGDNLAPTRNVATTTTDLLVEESDDSSAEPGQLDVHQRYGGITVPLGMELEFRDDEGVAFVPFCAWAPLFALATATSAECADCLVGLGEVDRRGLGTLWVGFRLESRRARPEPSVAPPPPTPSTAEPPPPPAEPPPPPAEPPVPESSTEPAEPNVPDGESGGDL